MFFSTHSSHSVGPSVRRPSRTRALSLFGFATLFLLSLLCPLCAVSANAALQMSRESAHAALYRKLYEQMPAIWKSRLPLLVREVSDREMDRLVRARDDSPRSQNDDSDVEAFYELNDDADSVPTITVRESLSDLEAGFVFTHEYGHFIWEERLSERAQGDYFRIWQRGKRNKSLVSSYARESVEEGFSEAFAHFLRKRDLLHKRDPDSEAFLNDLLEG